MKTAIVIPARYGSSRFPGKPLAKIAGKTMLERVVSAARQAAEKFDDIALYVTSENAEIAAHADSIGAACIMTDEACATGSDRVLQAVKTLESQPDFIVNLQGDAPFTPPGIIVSLIEAFAENPALEVVTPVVRLSWDALECLREAKKITPFSGTSVIIDKSGRALWFSKTIIPAIRNEKKIREEGPLSPVHQHIGLYGYRRDVLERFCALPQSSYEKLEGLEQLRFLENGMAVQTVLAEMPGSFMQAGIDTPEDLKRAESLLFQHGDPLAK